MAERHKQYNEEEALSEAEKIKDLIGKSGTKADYNAAEKLVDEESKKERAETAHKKVLGIFSTYRSIIGALDVKEVDEIALNYNGDSGYSFINEFQDWEEDHGVLFRGWSRHEHDTSQNDFVNSLREKEPGEWNRYSEGILEALKPLDQIILSKGRKEAIIKITETSLDEFVKEYSDILQKIEGVKTRFIGPERQGRLLENLEHERKKLHGTTAAKLQKTLKKDGFEIGKENTRHLLALVYEMRKNLLQNDEFEMSDYIGHIPAIQKAIKDKFGFESDYFEYVIPGGMHEAGGSGFDDPIDYSVAELIIEQNTRRILKIRFLENTLVTKKDIADFIKTVRSK